MNSKYIAIDIHVFRNTVRDIPIDVFVQLSEENYAHVFSRSTGVDYKRLAQYIQKGVKNLFIRSEDEAAFREFIKNPAQAIFMNPEVPNEKKIAALINMTEQNVSEIFAQMNVPQETAEKTQQIIKNYVTLLSQNPKTLALILKLVSHGDYLYYHSIAVSIFSMFIAKASGQMNQKTLELVGLGGFLHDIGSIHLPKELVYASSDLNAEENEQLKSHTKLGLQMLEKTPNIPDEVRYIVYQHHEQPNGKGYPNGLHGPVIYYPAKIVAIADAFSELISKRPFRAAYSVEKAIEFMQSESGKYDRELVKLLATVFLKMSPSSQNGSGENSSHTPATGNHKKSAA